MHKSPEDVVVTCWWCGKPIRDPAPRSYSLKGYVCFMHGACADDSERMPSQSRPSAPGPMARYCSHCKRMRDDTGQTYGWALCDCGSFRHPTLNRRIA